MLKVLLLPQQQFTFWKPQNETFINGLKRLKRSFYFNNPTYESLYYHGLDNHKDFEVTVVGNLHSLYRKEEATPNSTNPSGFGILNFNREIRLSTAEETLNSFDAVIFSKSAIKSSKKLYKKSKKLDKLIVVIDYPEDDFFYTSNYSPTGVFEYGKDYHLYFKNHLRSGCRTDNILPLAPTPVNPSMYKFYDLPLMHRKISISFSGILDKEITIQNRKKLLNEITAWPKSYVKIISVNDHYKQKIPIRSEHDRLINDSQFLLCPAGRAWQTIRHTMCGLATAIPIVPFPDVEVIDFNPRDLENGIFYPMLYGLSDKEIDREISILKEKIRMIQCDKEQMSLISKRWNQEVLSNHTTNRRSDFIINAIKDKLR